MVTAKEKRNQAYTGLMQKVAFPQKRTTIKSKPRDKRIKNRQTGERFDISTRYWQSSPWAGLTNFLGQASYIEGREDHPIAQISMALRDIRSALPREYAIDPPVGEQNQVIANNMMEAQKAIGIKLAGRTVYQVHTNKFGRELMPLLKAVHGKALNLTEGHVQAVVKANGAVLDSFVTANLVTPAEQAFMKIMVPFTKSVTTFRGTLNNVSHLPQPAQQAIQLIIPDVNAILVDLTNIVSLTADFIDSYYNPMTLAKALFVKGKLRLF